MRAFVLPAVLVTSGCLLGEPPEQPPRAEAPRPAEPLRRLSNVELANTLADLFPNLEPGVDAPRVELPPTLAVDGLENNATSLGANDLFVARWRNTVQAWARAATAPDGPLEVLAPCALPGSGVEPRACHRTFIRAFGRRAFRAPLEDDLVERIAARMDAWASRIDTAAAIELGVTAMLQMPQFLYRLEAGETVLPSVTDHELATRLAYALWSTTPDERLLARADEAALGDDTVFAAEVERMLDSPNTSRAIAEFLRQWLDTGRILAAEHALRTQASPAWTSDVPVAAHEELVRFFRRVAERDDTLSALLTSREAEVSPSLAPFYGVEVATEGWTEVTLPEGYAGVLTRIAFTASHSHRAYPSPPIRGAFVLNRLFCEPPVQPPASADTSQPSPPPGAIETNRASFARRTSAGSCAGCHERLDGLGFVFESFDERGVLRSTDNGLPVDSSGTILGTDVDGPVRDAAELSQRLSTSRVVAGCYAERWASYVWGRRLRPRERVRLGPAVDALVASGGDTRALLRTLILDPSFRRRTETSE